MNQTTEALNLTTILVWIIENQDNTAAMEKINQATYPFTNKYAERKRAFINTAQAAKVTDDRSDR